MNPQIILPIVVLLVVTFLIGRAIKGPQKQFARISLLLIFAGWGMNMHIEDASDPLALISSALILFGLSCFLLMLIVQFLYFLHGKFKKQSPE